MQKKIPAILSDINGVLLKSNKPISKRISSAVNQLRQYKCIDNKKFQIPFVCITNEFHTSEIKFAEYLNNQFELKDDHKFNQKHIVLSHSPLHRYKSYFEDKKILFIGDLTQQEYQEIADNLFIKNFITQNEYFRIIGQFNEDQYEEQKTFNQSIDVVIFLSAPQDWEKTLGVFDVIRQSKGYKQSQLFKSPSFISMHSDPLEVSSNSLINLPRINIGVFNEIFKKLHLKLYHFDAQIDVMGKPEKESFELSRNMLRRQSLMYSSFNGQQQQQQKEEVISNYYMIGDDPYSDIFGANNFGWRSILVRTGVFQGVKNDKVYPAKYVVDDFYEAIKLIEQLEGIKLISNS